MRGGCTSGAHCTLQELGGNDGALSSFLQRAPGATKDKDKAGDTPLHSLCYNTKIVRLAFAAGAWSEAAKGKTADGDNPLHILCCNSNISATPSVLKCAPGGPKKKNKHGGHPLHYLGMNPSITVKCFRCCCAVVAPMRPTKERLRRYPPLSHPERSEHG